MTTVSLDNHSIYLYEVEKPTDSLKEIWDDNVSKGDFSTRDKVIIIAGGVLTSIPLAFVYLAKGVVTLAKWTFNRVLLPVGRLIKKVVKEIFVSAPLRLYRNVIRPTAVAIRNAVVWTDHYVSRPYLRIIANFCRLAFKRLNNDERTQVSDEILNDVGIICDNVIYPVRDAVRHLFMETIANLFRSRN
ncbi:MAG: hypothetical protein WD595_06825 [Waddliaceae bacterium]